MATERANQAPPVSSVGRFAMFAAFVRKEAKHVVRDRRSLFILLGLPVVMMILFGFALSNEVKSSRFVVLDRTPDLATMSLIRRFRENQYFSYAGDVSDEAGIDGWFRRGEARFALVFPSQFDHDLQHEGRAQLRLVADASDPNTARTITNYAMAIVAREQGDMAVQDEAAQGIRVETRMLYNPQLKSSYMFVPGVMTLLVMLLGAMMTSVSIVREKERGTMEILLVSPMDPLLLILGKVVPYMLLSLVNVAVILLLAYGVLGLPMGANIPLLLAESLLFILTTLSLGLVISNLVDRQQTAMFISLVGLLMPALVFSGFMFPIQNMPIALQRISLAVPTRWFYEIASNIMIKHEGLTAVIKPTIVLVAMTLGLMAIAARTFKRKL